MYSITYNNSIYTGIITVTEDQPTLPAPEPEKKEDAKINLVPKAIEHYLGEPLNQSIEYYLPPETDDVIKKNAKLDLSKVDINKEGQQEYTISYNGKSYTGYITIKKKENTNP